MIATIQTIQTIHTIQILIHPWKDHNKQSNSCCCKQQPRDKVWEFDRVRIIQIFTHPGGHEQVGAPIATHNSDLPSGTQQAAQ